MQGCSHRNSPQSIRKELASSCMVVGAAMPDEYGRMVKEEKPQNVVTIEELEEAGRQQDAERYGTIEEARAAWAKKEEAKKMCKA